MEHKPVLDMLVYNYFIMNFISPLIEVIDLVNAVNTCALYLYDNIKTFLVDTKKMNFDTIEKYAQLI